MKQTLYIASPESKQIHVWKLNVDGTLTLLQVIDVPGQVQPMTISPDKHFLYAGVRPQYRIITYFITKNYGILNFVKEFSLHDSSPTYISTDHTGNFLFSCSYNSGTISVVRLENGITTEITDIVKGLEGCHSVNISPDKSTLWVPVLKQDRICLFNCNNSGKLMIQSPSELRAIPGTGPRHMVFHPKYQYAYIINELSSSVDIWRFNSPLNNIKRIQTLDIMPAGYSGSRWASDIHITPNGKYLYTCDRISNMLTVFSVSEDGSNLTIEGFQLTEAQPRSFSIDASGKFLIIAGQKSHHIALYEITDKRGILQEKGRYSVGHGPTWVTVNAY